MAHKKMDRSGGVLLLEYFDARIGMLRESGRHGTAATYGSTRRSVARMLGGRCPALADVDGRFVEDYGVFLARCGVGRNTVSFYMRVLRALLRRAAGEGRLEFDAGWFRDVYTGVAPTDKRALDVATVRALARLDLGGDDSLGLSRDLFLFSFYARGMAFVDVAYLRRDDVRGGYLCYRRRKTGQLLKIRMEPEMRVIAERYGGGAGDFLFPVLTAGDYREYRRALDGYNRRLRRLGAMLGGVSLSSYTVRHTWATVARDHSVPVSVISAALGHTSERTTQIYLQSISNDELDRANRDVIRLI